MSVRVYKYGLRPPTENVDLVRAHLRAGHDYRNGLVAIERGRRWAVRLLHVGPDIDAASEALRLATRSDRREAQGALARARATAEREARCEGGHWAVPVEGADRFPFSPLYELERIALLDAAAKRDAYALAECHWGTKLSVAAAADQSRKKTPLYDRLEPSDVRFRRAHFVPQPEGDARWGEGQIGIHVQGKPLLVSDMLAGRSNDVRLTQIRREGVAVSKTGWFGELRIRVGSEGVAPVWATFPIRMHRRMPDAGRVTWVRVSCRHDGPWIRWQCEITVDNRATASRDLSKVEGTLAIEPCWEKPGDELRVVRWADSAGASGEIALSTRDIDAFEKLAGLRSVRDTLRNDLVKRFVREIHEMQDAAPLWIRQAAAAMHLWSSPMRFYDLAARCRRESVGPIGRLLHEFCERDRHLWQYEAGQRRNLLGRRKHLYQNLSAFWARTYRTIIVDTRNFSWMARFGPESDLRFIASPSELRDAARAAFGEDAIEYEYREDLDEEGDPPVEMWPARAIERWRSEESTGGARGDKKRRKTVHGEGGAWASRKAAKQVRTSRKEAARNPDSQAAE